MKLFSSISMLFLITLLPIDNSFALESSLSKNIPINLTVGTGVVDGSYSNPLNTYAAPLSTYSASEYSGFSVTPSFSLMLEFFTSVTKSWHIKAHFSIDPSEGKMKYQFLGAGANYYFGSGNIMSSMDESWIHYAGYDIGFSRVIVISFGPTLNTVSTAADLGGHIGTNYRLSKEWNINAELGYSYALGISTVATSGSNIKSFIGISHML